jgi:hypothetical protein
VVELKNLRVFEIVGRLVGGLRALVDEGVWPGPPVTGGWLGREVGVVLLTDIGAYKSERGGSESSPSLMFPPVESFFFFLILGCLVGEVSGRGGCLDLPPSWARGSGGWWVASCGMVAGIAVVGGVS